MFDLFKKDKRIVLYARDVSGVLTVIKKSSVTPITSQVGFRDLKFHFDIGKPLFRMKNVFYYVVDVRDGQITVSNNKDVVSPELIDSIMAKGIIKQLVSNIEDKPTSTMIIMFLLCIGIGISVGYIVGNFIPFGA